jgi:hypothetical protein
MATRRRFFPGAAEFVRASRTVGGDIWANVKVSAQSGYSRIAVPRTASLVNDDGAGRQ